MSAKRYEVRHRCPLCGDLINDVSFMKKALELALQKWYGYECDEDEKERYTIEYWLERAKR